MEKDIYRRYFTGSDELYRVRNILTGLEISLDKEQRSRYDILCKLVREEFWCVAEKIITQNNSNKVEDIQENLTRNCLKRLVCMSEVLDINLEHLKFNLYKNE